MKIVISIPHKFEKEYDRDKFEKSLNTVLKNAERYQGSYKGKFNDRYELETLEMLIEALIKSDPLE